MRTYAIKNKCSRCPRILAEREATLDEVLETAEQDGSTTFRASLFEGTELSFGELCATCAEHVDKSLRELFSPIETASAKRGRKRRAGEPDPGTEE